MTDTGIQIVTIADRPELVLLVGEWLWEAFDHADGSSLEQSRASVAASAAHGGVPQTFVLLAHGQPMATASLVAEDAPERPDLTPWLAGVFVRPEGRGRGYAARLVGRVETAAREAAVKRLWLYTHAAERLYAGLGWRRIEGFDRGGREAVLMRRDLPRGVATAV